MHRGFRGVREKPERPADPAVRRANLHRIARLFTGYRGRLSAVLALILVSAAFTAFAWILIPLLRLGDKPQGRAIAH